MRKYIFTLCALLALGSVAAKPVDVITARQVATNFWNAHRDAGVAPVSSSWKQIASPFDALYIFANGQQGFVIVSADDCVQPVLGYSFSNPASENLNPEVHYWLSTYQQEIDWMRANGVVNAGAAEEWKLYSVFPQGDPQPLTAVSPLLSTTWDQSPYYNNLCPYDYAAGERAVTGCVATATAQVMKYWNHPAQGSGSHSYYEDDYGTLSANFGATTYQWSSMPSALTGSSSTAQVNAVATLMYHIGVAIEMNYGVDASGAQMTNYGYSYNQVPSTQDALRMFFGYTDSIEALYRDNYGVTDAVWKSYVKNEIDASRPVLYSGFDSTGGHCFVCDGYNTAETQFHFNWGWSGYFDGYFSLNNLALGGGGTGSTASYTFNLSQQILLNVHPSGGGSGVAPDPNCLISSFPYTENFDDTTTYSCLRLLDANNDGQSWGVIDSFGTSYSVAAYITYAVAADDYLILPGIVTPGSYTVTWKARAYDNTYPESYQVLAGSNVIFNETLSSTSYVTRSATFSVSAGDTVNVMFRYISDDMYAFFIDDITISQSSPGPTQYTITVNSNNNAWGTVTGGGTYNSGATATLTATANSGYYFVSWQDGNTTNPRTVTVTGNATYTATFAASAPSPVNDDCIITSFPYTENFDDPSTYSCIGLFDANNDGQSWGVIDSFGTSYSVAAYIMYAVAADDYLILPGIVTPGSYTVTWKARAYDNTYPESYQVLAGSNVIFNETLSSTSYVTRSATFSVSAGDTVNVMFRYISDDMYAFFIDDITISQSSPGPTQYTITVLANNASWGNVTGSGTYPAGATVTISAMPYSGYYFDQWQDGETQATRTITVTGDATYIATFTANNGIEDVDSEQWVIFPNPASDVVSIVGVGQATVVINDLTGRKVAVHSISDDNNNIDVSSLAAGVYFLHISSDGVSAVRKLIVK